MPSTTGVACGERDHTRSSATWITEAAQVVDGSPSMAETRKWLGHGGDSSDSLAKDTVFGLDHEP
jgi:hypothetical protein